MIILYEKTETEFNTLGIGVLTDVREAEVEEEINGTYEFTFEYLLNGKYFNEITEDRIVLTKPNPFDDPEPFRIYKITKESKGYVKVYCQHISYDMSNYIVNKFDEEATDLQDALTKIQNGINRPDCPFTFSTDLTQNDDGFNQKLNVAKPTNLRTVLGGSDNSILALSKAEAYFSRYHTSILKARGQDRGFTIRYGKNLIELSQDIDYSSNFSGVYPVYVNTRTDYKTNTNKSYTQCYIYKPEDPNPTYANNWLTSLKTIPPFLPLRNFVAIQIADDEDNGDYKNKIYYWDTKYNRYYEIPGTEQVEDGVYTKTYEINFSDGNNTSYNSLKFEKKESELKSDVICKFKTNFQYVDNKTVKYEVTSDIVLPETTAITFRAYANSQNGLNFDDQMTITINKGDNSGSLEKIYNISDDDKISVNDISNPDPRKKTFTAYYFLNIYYGDTLVYSKDSREEKTDYWVNSQYKSIRFGANSTSDLISFVDRNTDYMRNYSSTSRIFDQKIFNINDDETKIYSDISFTSNGNTYDKIEIVVEDTEEILSHKEPKYIKYYSGSSGIEVYNFTTKTWTNSAYRTISILSTSLSDDTIEFLFKNTILTDLSAGNKQFLLNDSLIGFAYPTVKLSANEPYTVTNILTLDGYENIQNGILYADGRETDSFKKIYYKDFTSDFKDELATNTFDEGQTELYHDAQAKLYDLAKKFVDENITNKVLDSLTVSFIRLSESSEYENLKNLETVKLGDLVNVYYEKLGVSATLKVKNLKYNPINDRYTEVTMGIVEEKLSNTVLTTNSRISSLNNDSGYVNQPNVSKEIANTITADFIEAANANLSNAQIENLKTVNVDCSGIITASSGTIDTVVSKLLTAENAEISNTLKAGNIVVTGTINAVDGIISNSINVGSLTEEGKYLFTVDRTNNNISLANCNISANSITTSRLNVNAINAKRINAKDAWFGNCFIGSKDTIFGSNTETICTFTSSAILNPNNIGQIICTVISSNNVPENNVADISFIVNFKRRNMSTNTLTDDYVVVNCSIPSGSDRIVKYVDIFLDPGEIITNIRASSPEPSRITFDTSDSSNDFLMSSSHFAPSKDGTYSDACDLGTSEYRWRNLYLAGSVISNSDRRVKNNINYDISNYSKIFDSLKPASYEFNGYDNGITHLGFIAQDVEQTLKDNSVPVSKFACLAKNDNIYGLRYSELHAMEVYEIQNLKKRINILEEKYGRKE